jgi:universal stress protein A
MNGVIIVGTDFSSEADQALYVAVELGKGLHRQIEIVHVHQPVTYVLPPPLDVVTLPESGQDLVRAQEALDRRKAEVEPGTTGVTTALLAGEGAATLVAHAQARGASLLVVGSRGSTGLSHILLGSVAERVIRHATCPVLVVPRSAAAHATERPAPEERR